MSVALKNDNIKLRLRKGDKVVVVTGRDKGKKGEIITVFPKLTKVLVSGVNIVKRHTKASKESAGGIINKEAPIHISNLAIQDPHDGSPTRIGYKITAEGRKVRFAKRSGEMIDA